MNLHGDERCDHLSLPMVGAEPPPDKPTSGAEMRVFICFKLRHLGKRALKSVYVDRWKIQF